MTTAPKKFQKAPITPGEFLIEEFLKPIGITQVTFAEAVGLSEAYLSDIVTGRRSISAEIAMRFEAALGLDASFWLRAQVEVDLYAARRDAKIREAVKKIKRIISS